MSETKKKATPRGYISQAFAYAKDYFFNSDKRWVAWLLLIGATLCVIALVGVIAAFSWWSIGFWAALMAKDLSLLLVSTGIFAAISAAFVLINGLGQYLKKALAINWREWLTNKLMDKYLSNKDLNKKNNYLDIKRHQKQLEHPEQRIQEDVKSFVEKTLSLGFDFLKSVCTLVVFSGSLWVIGGGLSFVLFGTSLFIPGYLVWIAIAFALITSVAAHYIGSPLTSINSEQEKLEAEFRKELHTVTTHAESIALQNGEPFFQKSLNEKNGAIADNAYKGLNVRTRLSAFQDLVSQMPSILPYIASAPLYFLGQIELGQLMQVGMSFNEVSNALTWFIHSYQVLSQYKASVERLAALEYMLDGGLESTPKGITLSKSNVDQVCIESLNMTYPSSTQFMIKALNLQFKRGENTLIKAPSGFGKSTLFKAIASSYRYGDGKVTVPSTNKVTFFPQETVIPPNSTLRAVLAYPDSQDTYDDNQYLAALEAVGKFAEFTDQLSTKQDWSFLSHGQRQRIAFARVLLKKPDWLFLDEPTASLDKDSEKYLYEFLQKNLKDTTLVSISHNPTVEKYHKRRVTLQSQGDDLPTLVTDEQIPSTQANQESNAVVSSLKVAC